MGHGGLYRALAGGESRRLEAKKTLWPLGSLGSRIRMPFDMRRLCDVFQKPQGPPTITSDGNASRGGILCNLAFRYSEEHFWLCHNLRLTVTPGHLTALMAPRSAARTLSPRAVRFCHSLQRVGYRDLLAGCGLALFAASPSALAFDCLIEPTQTVELASPVTGLLDKVLVKRADRVAKGQVVATLESRAEYAAAELARFKSEQLGPTLLAENKIEFAKRKFRRRQAMAQEKLMAIQDSDDAEGELRVAESELKVATENRQLAKLEHLQQSSLFNLRTIRSPFDGVVVDQMAYPGEVVEPGSNKKTILKVAQLDPLQIHVVLSKDAFGMIGAGMAVEVLPEIPPKERYTAKVKSVDRLIDAASGTFVVLLEMPNPKLEIPAGVKCKASFVGVEAEAGRGAATDKRRGQ